MAKTDIFKDLFFKILICLFIWVKKQFFLRNIKKNHLPRILIFSETWSKTNLVKNTHFFSISFKIKIIVIDLKKWQKLLFLSNIRKDIFIEMFVIFDYIGKKQFFQRDIKQARTKIGLADTLIPSSFIYLIYMGGTGPCDSINIIFGYHVNS